MASRRAGTDLASHSGGMRTTISWNRLLRGCGHIFGQPTAPGAANCFPMGVCVRGLYRLLTISCLPIFGHLRGTFHRKLRSRPGWSPTRHFGVCSRIPINLGTWIVGKARRSTTNNPTDRSVKRQIEINQPSVWLISSKTGKRFSPSPIPMRGCVMHFRDAIGGQAGGASLAMSTTQSQLPSASRRQMDMPRVCTVIRAPFVSGTVISSTPAI